MATMNISLPEHLKDWVETQTKSGRYANASDYVRDLIRKDQDLSVGVIQRLISEGLESGEPTAFDVGTFLKARRAEHGNPANPLKSKRKKM